jgi:dTDP-4-amino-4,6-dideoxy-D-galactose acyltransferase
MIRCLEWDSKFFSMKIGKVQKEDFSISDLIQVEKQKIKEHYDLIYIFVNPSDLSAKRWLNAKGMEPIDLKITYRKVTSKKEINNILRIEKYTGIVTADLLELAIASGHKSRFYKDFRLNARFVKLYTYWIEKSVNRELSDEVLVSIQDEKLTGFVTLKKTERKGSIGLIAVDKEFRGIGIGKELLIAAENWFRANNCNEICVITQSDNIQACALYERAGYKIDHSQLVYHF